MEPFAPNFFICLHIIFLYGPGTSRNFYVIFFVWTWHIQKFLCEFTMAFFCSNCVWIMYHTEICLQTANESEGPQTISHKQCGDKMAFRLVV